MTVRELIEVLQQYYPNDPITLRAVNTGRYLHMLELNQKESAKVKSPCFDVSFVPKSNPLETELDRLIVEKDKIQKMIDAMDSKQSSAIQKKVRRKSERTQAQEILLEEMKKHKDKVSGEYVYVRVKGTKGRPRKIRRTEWDKLVSMSTRTDLEIVDLS